MTMRLATLVTAGLLAFNFSDLVAQADWPWLLRVNFSNLGKAGTEGKPVVPAGHVLVQVGLLFSYSGLAQTVVAPVVKVRDADNKLFSMLDVVDSQSSNSKDVADWLRSGARRPTAVPLATAARLRANLFTYYFAVPEEAMLPLTLTFEGRAVELWLFDLPGERGSDGETHNKRMKLTKPVAAR